MLRQLFLASTLFLLIASCNNGPGPGGQASITGKVRVIGNWNSTCTLYQDSLNGFAPYYGPDYDVYLIYGDDPAYGDRVKSGPDGTFQFNYLRTGKYTVYVYSKDCAAAAGITAVKETVEINDRKEAFVIANNINVNR